jgi:hypothetical protein
MKIPGLWPGNQDLISDLNIKKPVEIAKSAKTIEIKPGAPPKAPE